MLQLAQGWELHVDYSSEWLFFHIKGEGLDLESAPPVVDTVWSMAEEQNIYRLVVEVNHSTLLDSYLIGQLVILHKRSHLKDGVFRICGFSPENYAVVRIMNLANRLPNYPTREAAVLGELPRKPR